jgi:hypothetical protein
MRKSVNIRLTVAILPGAFLAGVIVYLLIEQNYFLPIVLFCVWASIMFFNSRAICWAVLPDKKDCPKKQITLRFIIQELFVILCPIIFSGFGFAVAKLIKETLSL